jgi:hypothetical protein
MYTQGERKSIMDTSQKRICKKRKKRKLEKRRNRQKRREKGMPTKKKANFAA